MRNRFHIVLGAIIVAFIAIAVYLVMQQPETKHSLSYLALGDSYTIGYKVRYADNYPNQVAGFLRGKHFDIGDPSIIAYPGWTTNDLAKAISEKNSTDTFSFVTLLIGNNDIFDGYSTVVYSANFEQLIKRAIKFAAGHPDRVFVLSIPDISLTRYAADRDKGQIAKSIIAYNAANKEITLAHKCHYIDISGSLAAYNNDSAYYISDWAHPSAKGYAIWVGPAAAVIANALK